MKLKSTISNYIEDIKIFFWNLYLQLRYRFILKFMRKKIYYFFRKNNKIKGWILTFFDEFKSYSLDSSKWDRGSHYGLRFHPGSIEHEDEAPTEWYSDDCIEATSTHVKLKAIKKPVETFYNRKKWRIEHQIGMINTSNSFSQKNGYFEIKATVPASEGMWPVFWLASSHVWPPEIDVFEIFTGENNGKHKMRSNVHSADHDRVKIKPTTINLGLDLSKRPYTYGCEWDCDYIKFYFQDQLIRVVRTPVDYSFPMHIVVNNSVDPEYNGPIEFPNHMSVFYVRAYTKKRS